jgi:hypothetical protein
VVGVLVAAVAVFAVVAILIDVVVVVFVAARIFIQNKKSYR